jgi:hypothetical protein
VTQTEFAKAAIDGIAEELPADRKQFFIIDDLILAALMSVVSFFTEHWLQQWWDSCHHDKPTLLMRFHNHRMLKSLREHIRANTTLGPDREWLAEPLFASMQKRIKGIGADADGLMATWHGINGGQA